MWYWNLFYFFRWTQSRICIATLSAQRKSGDAREQRTSHIHPVFFTNKQDSVGNCPIVAMITLSSPKPRARTLAHKQLRLTNRELADHSVPCLIGSRINHGTGKNYRISSGRCRCFGFRMIPAASTWLRDVERRRREHSGNEVLECSLWREERDVF